MKIVIVIVIFIILSSLISAFVAMINGGDSHSSKFYKSLRLRIILTISMMIFLVLAVIMGWIEPNRVILDQPA